MLIGNPVVGGTSHNAEFIRDEVEKMKEARELAQKEQQELKIEQEKIREQEAKLEAEEEQRLQAQQEKTQNSIL